MFDLGKETTLEALGRKWTAGRLEFSVIEEWVAWAAGEIGDPFAGLEKMLPLLPPPDALALVKEAIAKRDALASMDMNDPLLSKLQTSVRGAIRLFWGQLKVYHPEVTLNQAFAIAAEVGMIRIAKAIDAGKGKAPPGPNGAGADEAAPTGATSSADLCLAGDGSASPKSGA